MVYIRQSELGLGVLRILLAALSVFESGLLLLAIGHDGTLEGLSMI